MIRRKISFPSAFTILFLVLIFAGILTYVVNAGAYATLTYDSVNDSLIETLPDGTNQVYAATQDTLDQLGVANVIEKFRDGSITNPVAIPGTYQKIEQQPQGVSKLLLAPIQGVYDSIDIILFVFIMGGIIGVINASGSIHAGIQALSRQTKGKEYLLIVFVTGLIALGGTTFGLAEEIIAFYPILIPVYLAAGYDPLICVGALYMGSSIGTMFSTTNPFSAVIGSNAAGIEFTDGMEYRLIGFLLGTLLVIGYLVLYGRKIKKNPELSLVYNDKPMQQVEEQNEFMEFHVRQKLILMIFFFSFIVMIYGVSKLGWWFEEMTALFLVSSFIVGVLAKIKEKEFIASFLSGAADLMGVAFIIGIARSINLVLDNGSISDTILYHLSNLVSGMNANFFVITMLLVFFILGFFISSSSGLATLSIPIMAPLADAVGISREVIITAFIFGQGIMLFITPTGLILASLEMVNVSYQKWIRFVLPVMGLITLLAVCLLLIEII